MKLNWVTLKVSDLENSLFFYHELLEFEIASQFATDQHQIVMLGSTSGPKIELIYEENIQIDCPGEGVSIGIEVDGLDKTVDRLKERGLSLVGPISPKPSIRFFFVKDPDGYTVQLVEQK